MIPHLTRATLVSFDPSTYTALVMLDGSVAEVAMPVGEWVPAQLLAADDEVAVLLFQPTNYENGVILGPFGGLGLLSSYVEQAEIAAPGTPASGFLRWYADSTHSWGWFKNDAGAAVPAGLAVLNLPIGAAELDTATRVVVASVHHTVSLADAAIQSANWSLVVPPGWPGRTLTSRCLWAPSSTNTGSARLFAQTYLQRAGTTLSASATTETVVTQAAAGTADRPQLVTLSMSLSAYQAGDALTFRLGRTGAHADDTFTGAVRLVAVELSVVG